MCFKVILYLGFAFFNMAMKSGYLFPSAKELSDTQDLGSCLRVRVRLPPGAPDSRDPNRIFQMGDGFGSLLFFSYDFFSDGAPVRKESKPRSPGEKKEYDDSS